MADEHKFIIEIAQFMGGIDKVLGSIERVLESLPKSVENEKIFLEVMSCKEDIEDLRLVLEEHDKYNKTCTDEFKNLLIVVNEQVEKIIKITNSYSFESYIDHIKKVDSLHDELCINGNLDRSDQLHENIREAGKLAREVHEELAKLKIIFKDEISLEDFREIVIASRKINEINEKWTLKKKIILGAVGIILSLLLFSDKFISIGHWLEEGKSPVKTIEESFIPLDNGKILHIKGDEVHIHESSNEQR